MSEEVYAFVGFELLQRIGGGSLKGIDGSRGGLADMSLELGEGVFDRIEVGTVGRQIAELGAAGFNSLAAPKIVVTGCYSMNPIYSAKLLSNGANEIRHHVF